MKTIKLMTTGVVRRSCIPPALQPAARTQLQARRQQSPQLKTARRLRNPRRRKKNKKSWISGSVGTVVTNEYIFIGLVQDKDTVILQPYLNLSFSLYEGEGAISAVSFELPLWCVDSRHQQASSS